MLQFQSASHRVVFTILALTMLALPACGGRPTPPPTPALAVVVFETEEPTASATVTPIPAATPTAAATVGAGINADLPAAGDSAPANRAPNVNPLTGLIVDDPALLHRRPLMVRVGNDPGARPQVALSEADVVYEELVEWWVTRFTAIYLSQTPDTIAPIRSARLINLHLTPQYQGVLANSGGSDAVRWELSQSDVINLDEFFIPQPFFYRPNEGWQTRLALHGQDTRDYLADEGLDTQVNLRGFTFNQILDVTNLPKEAVAPAQTVVIPYPAQTSQADWQYDPAGGKYLRAITGEPMMAFEGGQIGASNVIIYFADHQATDIVEDSNGATSIRINMNGLGTAWLLRDGVILKGNWQTDGRNTPEFIFNNGQVMPLKPGNTWVQVTPLEFKITIDGQPHTRLGGAEAAPTGSPAAPTKAPSPTLTPIGARPATTATPVP